MTMSLNKFRIASIVYSLIGIGAIVLLIVSIKDNDPSMFFNSGATAFSLVISCLDITKKDNSLFPQSLLLLFVLFVHCCVGLFIVMACGLSFGLPAIAVFIVTTFTSTLVNNYNKRNGFKF